MPSYIKWHVCVSYFPFKLEHLEEIARERMSEFGLIIFNKYSRHVYKEEENTLLFQLLMKLALLAQLSQAVVHQIRVLTKITIEQ